MLKPLSRWVALTRPELRNEQSADGASLSVRHTSAGLKLAMELAELGLVLKPCRQQKSLESVDPTRWLVSHHDYPRITAVPFATLEAVEAWWRNWATGAIADDEFLGNFRRLCDSVDLEDFDAIARWLWTANEEDRPVSLTPLFERLATVVAKPPSRWRAQSARLHRARQNDQPMTFKMKMNRVFWEVSERRGIPAGIPMSV